MKYKADSRFNFGLEIQSNQTPTVQNSDASRAAGCGQQSVEEHALSFTCI